jgi:chromosome segregation ATPase
MKITDENIKMFARQADDKNFLFGSLTVKALIGKIKELEQENKIIKDTASLSFQALEAHQQEIEQRGTWIDQQATKILRLQEAIAKAREAIELYKSGWPTIARAKADEALEQIDKAEDTANRYDECPYWKKDRCTGYNCCGCIDCPHAKEYQPWLFVDGAGGGGK